MLSACCDQAGCSAAARASPHKDQPVCVIVCVCVISIQSRRLSTDGTTATTATTNRPAHNAQFVRSTVGVCLYSVVSFGYVRRVWWFVDVSCFYAASDLVLVYANTFANTRRTTPHPKHTHIFDSVVGWRCFWQTQLRRSLAAAVRWHVCSLPLPLCQLVFCSMQPRSISVIRGIHLCGRDDDVSGLTCILMRSNHF